MIGKGTESKIENVTMPLYRSVIHTDFDYRVQFPSFLKDILKLEKVQRGAASIELLRKIRNNFCVRSNLEDNVFSAWKRGEVGAQCRYLWGTWVSCLFPAGDMWSQNLPALDEVGDLTHFLLLWFWVDTGNPEVWLRRCSDWSTVHVFAELL